MSTLRSQPEPTIQHFSHPHPLELSYHQTHQNLYPEGFFKCDACGKQGNGFSYHCKICRFDLHILCALTPFPVALHHEFHPHQLYLSFSPPYHNKSFSCNICSNGGSDHWLYRCDSCNFDAHLTCATANHGTPIQPIQMTPTAPVQVIQASGTSYGVRPWQIYPQNNNMVNHCQNNTFTSQIIQGFIDGAAQAVGKVLFQGFMGGGDGGALDGSSFQGDQCGLQ